MNNPSKKHILTHLLLPEKLDGETSGKYSSNSETKLTNKEVNNKFNTWQ